MLNKRTNGTHSIGARENRHLTADRVKPKDTKWVWWPRIPGGNITILAAKGGTGKGLLCSDLVASITLGSNWPLTPSEDAPEGSVLWCEAEDSFDYAVVPRLYAAQADLARVYLKKPEEFFELNLREFILEHNVKLIVLSPLNSFMKDLKDANHGLNVRQALERLQAAIENTDCAVLAICHLNKKTDLDAVERVLGSVEYANFVRSVLLLQRNYDDEVVRMVHVKSNLGPHADDLTFEIRNTKPKSHPRGQFIRIRWSKPEKNVDPDKFLDRSKDNANDAESAGDWLFDYLRDGTWKDTADIFAAGERHSHSVSSLKKAKQRSAGKIAHRRQRSGDKPGDFWRLATG